MTHFIGIASGKGGVGKTTLAINLGLALTNFSRDVIVVDANLITPDIGLQLGAPLMPCNLNEVIAGKKSILEAVYLHPSGLKIIPASLSLKEIKKTNYYLLKNVLLNLEGKTELVIVDTQTNLGKEKRLKGLDSLLIVTTPELAAVTDNLKLLKLAKKTGLKIIGIVVNQSHFKDFELSVKNIETMLDCNVIATIPYDENIIKSIYIKHPVIHSYPDSQSTIAFKKLAAKFIGFD